MGKEIKDIESLLKCNNIKKVLLIDPAFPTPNKSRNHKDLLPVGLLKISTYLKRKGVQTKLIRLNDNEDYSDEIIDFNPNLVMVTSVFTYWFDEVKNAVLYSKDKLGDVNVMIGGIMVSLLDKKYLDEIPYDYFYSGVVEGAEHLPPDYSLLENGGKDINFQIIHSSRGCERGCKFCGVNKIEPKFHGFPSIENEIIRKNLVFYDNNLLRNPHVEILLLELIRLKKEKKITRCESQSGFDGRILRKNPKLAKLLKEANFKDPKIAWDGPYGQKKKRKKEIDILVDAGYNPKEIAVFMLYNHDLSYNDLEKKRAICFEWGVQISDCRFRPLDSLTDGYNPHKKSQERNEYYIHENWSDEQVRQFRRNVRRHNICIRHNMSYHSRQAELKKISKEDSMKIRTMSYEEVLKTDIIDDAWNPAEPYYIKNESKQDKLL